MSDQPPSPRSPIMAAVDAHVADIMDAATAAAVELQREVEQASLARGMELRRSAELEAQQIRAAAQAEADAYLEECRHRAELFANGRVARLQGLSDGLLARAETIRERLPEVEELHQSLQDLVAALTTAARTASAEATRPPIDLPRLVADEPAAPEDGRDDTSGDEADGGAAQATQTAPVRRLPRAEDLSGADTPPARGRSVAQDLPRLPRRPWPQDGPKEPPPA